MGWPQHQRAALLTQAVLLKPRSEIRMRGRHCPLQFGHLQRRAQLALSPHRAGRCDVTTCETGRKILVEWLGTEDAVRAGKHPHFAIECAALARTGPVASLHA